MRDNKIESYGSKKKWIEEFEKKVGKIEILENLKNVVYLLLDCSGSMSGTKIEQAKKGTINFAKEAVKKGYLVGLITFADEPIHVFSPKGEVKEFNYSLNSVFAGGSTNMSGAISLATEKLSFYKRERVICIVTDGMPDNPEATVSAAEKAKDMGIEIMAIGTDDADWNFLKQIVTRNELAVKVERKKFERGIGNMAKMLPSGN